MNAVNSLGWSQGYFGARKSNRSPIIVRAMACQVSTPVSGMAFSFRAEHRKTPSSASIGNWSKSCGRERSRCVWWAKHSSRSETRPRTLRGFSAIRLRNGQRSSNRPDRSQTETYAARARACNCPLQSNALFRKGWRYCRALFVSQTETASKPPFTTCSSLACIVRGSIRRHSMDDLAKRSRSGRSAKDRRSGADTRSDAEKNSIGERRSGRDRRSGSDRRSGGDRRANAAKSDPR
jgi:hypothetical protein